MTNLIVALANGYFTCYFLIGIVKGFKYKEKTPGFIYFLFILNFICFILNLIWGIYQLI